MGGYVGFNEKFEATMGEFIVHPDGWTGPATVENVEKIEEDGNVEAIVLHLDCEGAKVTERIGLKETEKYTRDLIKWKVSGPLVSCGVRKHGENLSPADLMKLSNKIGRVELSVSKFTSKNTGKELENNKVKRWLEPGTPAKSTKKSESKKETKDDFEF